ncbi:MAG: hypothetical protein GY694_01100, partial [Gammaproteobacteria bacterium]|nr:hypothetical protein [Gammaproteobacteria bacterium]
MKMLGGQIGITLAVVILLIPGIAVAEVSDKMATQQSILMTGVIVGIVAMLSGYFKWWISLIFLLFVILTVIGTISLWNEYHMREALLHEQGWQYFGVHGL